MKSLLFFITLAVSALAHAGSEVASREVGTQMAQYIPPPVMAPVLIINTCEIFEGTEAANALAALNITGRTCPGRSQYETKQGDLCRCSWSGRGWSVTVNGQIVSRQQ